MKRQTLLLLLLVCFSIAQAIKPDSTTNAQIVQTWQEFRMIHPYGFQTVALKHVGNNSIIIASEPSPHVLKATIQDIFQKNGGYCMYGQQPLGHDGYLVDIMGIIPTKVIPDDSFTSDLFTALYGTDYKAFYTNLDDPVRHAHFAPFNYDLNYTERLQDIFPRERIVGKHQEMSQDENDEEDIHYYRNSPIDVLELRQPEYILTSAYHESISNIDTLSKDANIICYSVDNGYVAWLIDTNHKKNFLVNARQFSLDTDLILGAVLLPNNKLVIIGRERQVPVTIYPPLRAETILLMAQNHDKAFKQYFNSENVTHDSNGQYSTPITMTKSIRNTEYGNLLVQCDQMLKSWIENDYNQDIDYYLKAPAYFPFVNRVDEELRDLYTGYYWSQNVLKDDYCTDDSHILTVKRTGSLPVKFSMSHDGFIVTSALKQKEKIANEYFAELNQPELVRLAQYTMMHEIFCFKFDPTKKNRTIEPDFGIPSNYSYVPEYTESWVKTPTVSCSLNKWSQGGMLPPSMKFPKVPKGIKKVGISHSSWWHGIVEHTGSGAWRTELRRTELRRTELRRTEPRRTEPRIAEPRIAELQNTELWNTELWNTELWNTELWKRQLLSKQLEIVLQENEQRYKRQHHNLDNIGIIPPFIHSFIALGDKYFLPLLPETVLQLRGFIPDYHLIGNKIKDFGLKLDGNLFEKASQLLQYFKEQIYLRGSRPEKKVSIKGYSANEAEVSIEGKVQGIIEMEKIMDDPIFKNFGLDAPVFDKSNYITEQFFQFVYIFITKDYEPDNEQAA